jgi:hypothetical protein
VVLLAAGVATEGRLWHWVPASYAKLEEAERKILTRAIPTPFEMTKVAQLGTVVVPCSDEKKRADAKNLVLIHGFGGGNAVWAMVRGRSWMMALWMRAEGTVLLRCRTWRSCPSTSTCTRWSGLASAGRIAQTSISAT